MHSILQSAEKRIEAPADAPAGAERFLLAACLALMTVAVFLRNFDDPLLRAVYRLTHADNAAFWRGVSMLGSGLTLTPVVAAVVLALIWRNRSMSALALAFGWAATSLTVQYLKWLLDRDRPPVTPWIFARGDAFPSGHAAQSIYVYLSLAWGFAAIAAPAGRRLLGKVCWVILGVVPLAVGYSRVALGVHWPSDVAAGWAVGLFFLALAGVLREPSRPAARVAEREETAPGES